MHSLIWPSVILPSVVLPSVGAPWTQPLIFVHPLSLADGLNHVQFPVIQIIQEPSTVKPFHTRRFKQPAVS